MPYYELIVLLSYVAAYQMVVKYEVQPRTAAFIAIGLPFGLLVAFTLAAKAMGVDLIFDWSRIVIAIIAFPLAWIIFKHVREAETGIPALLWAGFGLAVVMFALPGLVVGVLRATGILI